MAQIRLNKFLAERLGVSRRDADELITSGKVTINSQKATLGNKVDEKSKVCCNGKTIPFETEYVYLAFNKPVGYVCSRRAQGSSPTLYDLLPAKYHNLKTVGRLDKDSSGLILLTNDGDFAYQMTHPKFLKTKVYELELDKTLEPLHQQMISDFGIMLDDGPSKFTVIKQPTDISSANHNPDQKSSDSAKDTKAKNSNTKVSYLAILTEGRNRQIRRTFSALGYKVTKLHRIEFGKFKLGKLKPKEYEIIRLV